MSLRKAFNRQRNDAKRRGIAFELTFDEWLTIWVGSGHLHERGRQRDQYVMSRFRDVGAYTVGNVAIIPQVENSITPHLGRPKSLEMRAKVSAANYGHAVSEDARAKISAARRGRALSAEHKLKLSLSLTGVSKSPEHRARIAAANRARAGRVVSAETRAKISLARKLAASP